MNAATKKSAQIALAAFSLDCLFECLGHAWHDSISAFLKPTPLPLIPWQETIRRLSSFSRSRPV
ncbi:MAG: hypothetical protein ACLP1W_08130, partial [Rhodomicrobium sp.]